MRAAALVSALVPAAVLALAAAPARAADEPARVELKPGERLPVCGRFASCPLMTSSCDDPKVARVEVGKAGAELRAGAAGTTLCGLVGSGGFRTVVRVAVKAPSGG